MPCSVIALPKSIDNDFLLLDKTFGWELIGLLDKTFGRGLFIAGLAVQKCAKLACTCRREELKRVRPFLARPPQV